MLKKLQTTQNPPKLSIFIKFSHIKCKKLLVDKKIFYVKMNCFLEKRLKLPDLGRNLVSE